MAAQYGVADEGYSTQAVFFDYDHDGKLDLFVLNNSPRPVSSFGPENNRDVPTWFGGHIVYHNEGGRIVDVTKQARLHEAAIDFCLRRLARHVLPDSPPGHYASDIYLDIT